MKIGMFGYPGERVDRVEAVIKALQDNGAEKVVCLGGLIYGGRRDEDPQSAAAVLRWLRANDVPTLANDTDRQIAGWRLQALENTTGYIQPAVRRFLSSITREEAQWIYSRPTVLPFENLLCCADNLTIDALFPVPLTRFNANRLFGVLEQKLAVFPSANGPSLILRKYGNNRLEAQKFDDIEAQIDTPKAAAVIGGVIGAPPLNSEISWSAVVDSDASTISLVCLDSRTLKPVPERAVLVVQQAEINWRE